jgi:surface polysaccharide O-acyltransferase-like enzyme
MWAEFMRGYAEGDIQQQETTRMQKVVKSSFTGGLVTYTVLVLLGVALVLASHDAPTRKGIALALMMVGVLGHCVETFSMQANRHYLEVIEARQ